MVSVAQVRPLDADGAASDCAGWLGDRNGLRITDRTLWPRFGLKGPASADWLRGAGIVLPDPNHLAGQAGLVVLRLGGDDVALLAEDGAPDAIAALRDRWGAAPEPKGYSSWREEAWAWLHLEGPALDEALARCCAVDLRPASFSDDRIAQTRFAHVDAVVIRRGGDASALFDISATGAVLATVRQDEGRA